VWLPAGASRLDGSTDVVVVGQAEQQDQNELRNAQLNGQPVLVVGAGRKIGSNFGDDTAPAVRTLLEQYAWKGKVPLVVTRGAPTTGSDLLKVLDKYGATLVHMVTMRTSAAGGLNLGSNRSWSVRGPGGEVAESGPENSLASLLTETMKERKRPAVGRPPAQLALYLSKPLTEHSPDVVEELSADLKMRPFLQQIAKGVSAYAPYGAAVELTGMGNGAEVQNYLGAGVGKRGATIFSSLLKAQGETPGERETAVQQLLPHLAALTHGVDSASEILMKSLDGLMYGTM
jgi:hypothetical protein